MGLLILRIERAPYDPWRTSVIELQRAGTSMVFLGAFLLRSPHSLSWVAESDKNVTSLTSSPNGRTPMPKAVMKDEF